MRAPRGLIEFEIEPLEPAHAGDRHRLLAPAGHLGLLYWYALVPAHLFIFKA